MQLPEIILEIGTNYYEVAIALNSTPLHAAKVMIDEAKKCGADAVKFQWYKADKLVRKDAKAYWPTDRTQHEVFSCQDTFGFDEYAELKSYCDEVGIEFMCTAFDLDILEQLNPLVKRHKIASGDITFQPLLEQVASYRKPVMLSTGASTDDEILKALELLVKSPFVALLHCVLNYPNSIYVANLGRITDLSQFTSTPLHWRGYSDHCHYDRILLTTAWLLGAQVIEKHFTLSHDFEGNDHYHAADPQEVREWIATMKTVQSMTDGVPDESKVRKLARRGCYLKRDVKKAQRMKLDDVEYLRPQNDGMSPRKFVYRCAFHGCYMKDMKAGEQL